MELVLKGADGVFAALCESSPFLDEAFNFFGHRGDLDIKFQQLSEDDQGLCIMALMVYLTLTVLVDPMLKTYKAKLRPKNLRGPFRYCGATDEFGGLFVLVWWARNIGGAAERFEDHVVVWGAKRMLDIAAWLREEFAAFREAKVEVLEELRGIYLLKEAHCSCHR